MLCFKYNKICLTFDLYFDLQMTYLVQITEWKINVIADYYENMALITKKLSCIGIRAIEEYF